VKVREPGGRLRVELIKEGRSCRCEIDLVTGRATLYRDTEQLGESKGTPLCRPGEHSLTLANVDDRLTLEVDGLLPFGEGCDYGSSPSGSGPKAADLEPARIASRGALVEVKGLVLKRDVYYTQAPGEADYEGLGSILQAGPGALFDLLADPDRFASLGRPPARDYPLGEGRYLMLGDNSPWSRDGRAWGRKDQREPGEPERGWDDSGRESWEVPETLIIGKAFCVYWPHPSPMWPMFRLGPDYRLPVRPCIERIRWIR
jgi:signal peptidase I